MRRIMKIKEFATVVSGATPKTNIDKYWNGENIWITPAELDNKKMFISNSERKLTEEGIKSTSLKKLPKGTVLLSSRAPIGKVAIASKELYCNQGFKNLICNEKIVNPIYIYYWLLSKTEYLNNLGRGATFKEISKKMVEDIEIPIPELEKQNQIVRKLNLLVNFQKKRQEQLENLDKLIKSKFIEMFGDTVSNSKGWDIKQLQDIGEWKSGGTPSRTNKEYFKGDIDWYSAGELNQLYLEGSVEKITQEAIQESSTKVFYKGSMLIGMYDTAAFKMGILQRDSASNQACANIMPNDDVDIVWLYYNLMHMKEHFLSNRRGIRQKNLNLGMIKEFEIPIPPIEIQKQFVIFVQQVEKQKFIVQQNLYKLQELFDSLMQQFFFINIENKYGN